MNPGDFPSDKVWNILYGSVCVSVVGVLGDLGWTLQEAQKDKRSEHKHFNLNFQKYTLFYWVTWVGLEIDVKQTERSKEDSLSAA